MNSSLLDVTSFGEMVELPQGYPSAWHSYQRIFLRTDLCDGAGRLTQPGKKDATDYFSPLFCSFGDVVSGTKERVQLVAPQQVVSFAYEVPPKPDIVISLNPEQVTELREGTALRYRRVRLLGHSNGEISPGSARDFLDVLFSLYELLSPVNDTNKNPAFFRAESHELRSLPVNFPVEREFQKFYGASVKAGFAELVRTYSSDSRSFRSYLDELVLQTVYDSL